MNSLSEFIKSHMTCEKNIENIETILKFTPNKIDVGQDNDKSVSHIVYYITFPLFSSDKQSVIPSLFNLSKHYDASIESEDSDFMDIYINDKHNYDLFIDELKKLDMRHRTINTFYKSNTDEDWTELDNIIKQKSDKYN